MFIAPDTTCGQGSKATFRGGHCICGTFPLSANVYIDGFNLYHGALRGTSYKWLNLAVMCRRLLPDREINRIRYFTARVANYPHDPMARSRQGTYLRALRTIPDLTIHYGRFSHHPATAPIYPLTYADPSEPPERVRILKTEEKRSDVNLATMLLIDCFDEEFDEAVVISNDSDLTLPIEYVIDKFGKRVGVINPHHRSRVSRELSEVATWFYRRINRSALANSQFPADMSDSRGDFRKPALW